MNLLIGRFASALGLQEQGEIEEHAGLFLFLNVIMTVVGTQAFLLMS